MSRRQHQEKRGPSNRQLKVGETLRHAIAEVFMREEVFHPDFSSTLVTVSEVRISPDLKDARVFVMPLGGANREKVMSGLVAITPQLRPIVTRMLHLKYSPRLTFVLDESFDTASRIATLIHQTKQREEKLARPSDEDE